MSSRNRKAGHRYEREIVKELREIGFENVATSRSCNKARDAQKVDIVNEDEFENGRLPYNIQAKNVSGNRLNYEKTLEELPDNTGIVNVVLRKYTTKSAEGKFMTKGKYAFMTQSDFFKMVKQIENLKKELLIKIA